MSSFRRVTAIIAIVVLTVLSCSAPTSGSSSSTTSSPVSATSLAPGQSVRSPDSRLLLYHQHDGNVVLYAYGSKALWSTQTQGRSTSRLVMQADGNLVLYDTANRAIWNTRTAGRGDVLAVQNDANVVVYDGGQPVWARFGMEPPRPVIPYKLRRIRGCESAWDPNHPGDYTAKNPSSSASGAYQFLDRTWVSTTGLPAPARAHSPATQDRAALKLYNSQGTAPWESSRSCWD
jgi:hypothetical protein